MNKKINKLQDILIKFEKKLFLLESYKKKNKKFFFYLWLLKEINSLLLQKIVYFIEWDNSLFFVLKSRYFLIFKDLSVKNNFSLIVNLIKKLENKKINYIIKYIVLKQRFISNSLILLIREFKIKDFFLIY